MPAGEGLDYPALTRGARRSAPWQAVVAEVLTSLTAAGVVVLIPLHYLLVRMTFFGAPTVIHDDDVQKYWMLVGALAVAVVASFAAARWRRGRKTYAWHVFVAVVGVVMAAEFSVAESGPVDHLDRHPVHQDRQESPGGSACHSGGDSDECVGG